MFDENGNFKRVYGPDGWKNDRDADVKILASRHDENDDDLADGLDQCLLADGRKPMGGSLKMSNNQIKNVGGATLATDAPNAKQVQSNAFNFGLDVSSTPNEIEISLNPTLTEQPDSMFLTVKVKNTNTAKTTLKINSLAAKPIMIGNSNVYEGALLAGNCYPLFYNKTLDAYQLLPSGSISGGAEFPLLSFSHFDALLTGDAAHGWELQGNKCYRTKYWDAYDMLAAEYGTAVIKAETVKGTSYTYKEAAKSKRRFYSLTDYNARFSTCGDSGGYVLDTDGEYFYLPKDINFLRATDTITTVGQYFDDTMRPVTGSFGGLNGAFFTADGAFYDQGGYGRDWDLRSSPGHKVGLNSGRLGDNFSGSETMPKHKLVVRYYRVGGTYAASVSSAAESARASAAEAAQSAIDAANYASNAAGSVSDAQGYANVSSNAATQAEASATAATMSATAAELSATDAENSSDYAAEIVGGVTAIATQALETAQSKLDKTQIKAGQNMEIDENADGSLTFNSTAGEAQVFNQLTENLTSQIDGVKNTFNVTADIAPNYDVWLNGIKLVQDLHYIFEDSQLLLSDAPTVGSNLVITYWKGAGASPIVGVKSVNGRGGAVTLTSSDVGLNNVENTSDIDKPISFDTQAALDNKYSLNGGWLKGLLNFIGSFNAGTTPGYITWSYTGVALNIGYSASIECPDGSLNFTTRANSAKGLTHTQSYGSPPNITTNTYDILTTGNIGNKVITYSTYNNLYDAVDLDNYRTPGRFIVSNMGGPGVALNFPNDYSYNGLWQLDVVTSKDGWSVFHEIKILNYENNGGSITWRRAANATWEPWFRVTGLDVV